MNFREVEETFRKEIAKLDLEGLILDLKAYGMINSAAMGWFVSVYKSMSKRDKKVAIVNASSHMLKVLSMTNISSLIATFEKVDHAREYVLSD